MTTTTLRPNGTVYNTGALTGAASAHAALSDDSDATYVTLNAGEVVVVNMGTFALPAGAVVARIGNRARVLNINVADVVSRLRFGGGIVGTEIYGVTSGNTVGPTAVSVAQLPVALSQTDVNNLQMLAHSQAADARIYELYLDLVYVVRPVALLTAPTNPWTASSQISVNWNRTLDSDGGSQTHYRLYVTNPAEGDVIVSDSGIVASATTLAITKPLDNGVYDIHLELAQTVNGQQVWSLPSSWTGIEVAVTPAGIIPANTGFYPQVGHNLVFVGWDNTTPTPELIQIERRRPATGADLEYTWEPVRGATLVAWDGTPVFEVEDWAAPNDVELVYRVRMVHYSGGLPIVSPWYEFGSPGTSLEAPSWSIEGDDIWVKVPGESWLSRTVCLEDLPTMRHRRRRTSHAVNNRPDPIVIADVRSTAFGTIVLQTQNQADSEWFSDLLDAGAVVLIQAPPALAGWGSRFCSISDDEERFLNTGRRFTNRLGRRSWVLNYEEVAEPTDPLAGTIS